MKEEIDYKKLYEELKEKSNTYLKHRNYCPKKCKYCRGWYNDIKKATKRIKNKKIRDNLMELWETLWINNCKDFDIIAYTFDVKLFLKTKSKKNL
jgi:hypothetical protein